MNIMVTGATGLVGSALLLHLKAEGHEVSRVFRQGRPAEKDILWNPDEGRIDLARLEGADAVVHLGSLPGL
jgi:nucleoside-diphosphate-sugar epimerase